MARLSIIVAVLTCTTNAFAPPSSLRAVGGSSSSFLQQNNVLMHNMVTELVTDVPSTLSAASATIDAISSSSPLSSSNLLSFADQGQNLAGIAFQASLLPYLIFLYFLSFRGNRTPNLGNFGWQYLLLFVFGTIPSGIITKSVYGTSLANV